MPPTRLPVVVAIVPAIWFEPLQIARVVVAPTVNADVLLRVITTEPQSILPAESAVTEKRPRTASDPAVSVVLSRATAATVGLDLRTYIVPLPEPAELRSAKDAIVVEAVPALSTALKPSFQSSTAEIAEPEVAPFATVGILT